MLIVNLQKEEGKCLHFISFLSGFEILSGVSALLSTRCLPEVEEILGLQLCNYNSSSRNPVSLIPSLVFCFCLLLWFFPENQMICSVWSHEKLSRHLRDQGPRVVKSSSHVRRSSSLTASARPLRVSLCCLPD